MTVIPLFVEVISKPESQVASLQSHAIAARPEGTVARKTVSGSGYRLRLPQG